MGRSTVWLGPVLATAAAAALWRLHGGLAGWLIAEGAVLAFALMTARHSRDSRPPAAADREVRPGGRARGPGGAEGGVVHRRGEREPR